MQHYFTLLWLLMMAHFVTRATPINIIDDKSHILALKSSRDYLTNHAMLKSHH